jgi:hypothetical protein
MNTATTPDSRNRNARAAFLALMDVLTPDELETIAAEVCAIVMMGRCLPEAGATRHLSAAQCDQVIEDLAIDANGEVSEHKGGILDWWVEYSATATRRSP